LNLRCKSRRIEPPRSVPGINFEDIKPAWLRAFIDSVDMDYPVLPRGTGQVIPLG
jgi:hypothetical protein